MKNNIDKKMQKLNTQQTNAVTAPLGPILVLAGAGSGKTRVLTNRILHLTETCGFSPMSILAITFTNKAANEMKNRLLEFDKGFHAMHISTIHSFCATVLRSEAQHINKKTNFTIYSEDDKESVLKGLLRDYLDDFDGAVVGEVSDVVSQLKNDADEFLEFCSVCKSAEQLNAYIQGIDSIKTRNKIEAMLQKSALSNSYDLIKIVGEYQSKIDQNNALDFDDLLYFTHKLFSTCPDVLKRYQQKFRFVGIDEFQDINKVQYEIFKMIANEHQNIFVVGDDDQSIYSWRGADVKHILNFPKDFPNAQVFKLEQNYRSTKKILNIANGIIALNQHRYEKQLWTENEDGVNIEMFSAYNESDEAYFVLKNIQGLHFSNKYDYKDCAILMRVNALSRSFEMECRKAGIPYKVFGGFKFFERKEIKDILAYINLIVNPFDTLALFRALEVPKKRGIGQATIKKLKDFSAQEGIAVIDIISDARNMEYLTPNARERLLDFHQLYSDLCELSKMDSIDVFVRKMLQILEFREVYMANDEDDRAMYVDEFELSVIDFSQNFPNATLADFMQSVTLVSDKESNPNDSDFVTIATIHAVKGLEYKAVFVVGLEEGIFPSRRAFGGNSQLDEERRLMYVAATRAKKRLFLTQAGSRFMYGQRKTMPPSRFFQEAYKQTVPQAANNFGVERIYPDNDFSTKFSPPSREIPNTGKSKKEISSFFAGQRVSHTKFGKGIILFINNGIADVLFDEFGKKSLSIKFAPLTILE